MTTFAEEGHFGRSGASRQAAEEPLPADSAPASAPASPEDIRDALTGKFVCPFCGSINDANQGICPRCTMENSPATRKATKIRIGPWYVLQSRNPAAPGMKFETLLNFARKGRVKPRSIVRGPTTHQLWKFAAQVKGLSREFGVCYSCGGAIDASASLCPQCNRLQDPPANPDVLLETKDAPAPAVPQRPTRNKEPDLAEIDAEFVIPALGGTGSEDSVAGVSLTGSMAGVAFDPTAASRGETPRNEAPPVSFSAGNASGGPPPNRVKRDEGFLTPKDLAAAFNLNFTPAHPADTNDSAARSTPVTGDRRRTPRPQPPREQRQNPRQRLQHPLDFRPHRAPQEAIDALAAPSFDAGLHEALAIPDPARKPALVPPPRPRHRFLKVFTFLIVFSIGLYVAAVFIDPTLRQQSQQVYDHVKSALLQTLNSDKPVKGGSPAHPTPSPTPADNTNTADVNDTGGASAAPANTGDAHSNAAASAPDRTTEAQPASASAPGPDAASPATAPSASSGQAPTAVPVRSPVSISHAPPTVAPPVPAAVAPPAGGDSRAATPTPPPTPAPASPSAPAAPAFDPATAATDSIKLYREAMRLEGTDPAKAVAKYTAIKKFPQDYWPGDLDVCIRRAESRLKPQQH